MQNYPKIETPRLILGEIFATDIPKIVEYAGNIKIANFTMNLPHPYQEKDAIFWINSAQQGLLNKTQYTFAIRIKEKTEFIGGIGLKVNLKFNHAEMGYWLAEPFWNNGYISEAVKGVLKFGFHTLGLNKIFASHLIENPASGKVMLKNGMIKEGELVEHFKKGDEYKTIIQYRLTKNEYEKLYSENS